MRSYFGCAAVNSGITFQHGWLRSKSSLNCCSAVSSVFQRPLVMPIVNMMKNE